MKPALTRRNLGRFALGGAAAAAATADSATSDAVTVDPTLSPASPVAVPFYGTHQAGIVTPAQDRLLFASFDVLTDDPAVLQTLLTTWTKAAAAMTQGRLVTAPAPGADADSPHDTGEAVGDTPGLLTVTIGYGRSLFDGRFGLADRQPALLDDLPAFKGDKLDPAISDGDIAVQACGNDPQVNFHAIRNLARLGVGIVAIRWLQSGFGRTSSTSPSQQTPRNLMGYKDGTRNIVSTETTALREDVWADAGSEQDWMLGGAYLVVRKIRMNLEKWDKDGLEDQDDTFGRRKGSGAPFTGAGEFDHPDFSATHGDGKLVIPADSHIRLAAHELNGGVRILRRGYSFTDGAVSGVLDSGLFFLAYMQDPAQFVTLQTKLAAHDALNEYIAHLSSAVFAVPTGLAKGDDWGAQLFSAS